MKNHLYFFLFVLSVSGCASNNANVDYDTAIDFNAIKSFAWSEKSDEATDKSKAATPLVHKRVTESIETVLKSKGLKKVDAAQADMLITYHLSVAVTGQTSSSVSVGFGRSRYGSGIGTSVGVSTSVPVGGRTVKEGTLVVMMMDTKTNSVIWQGSSSRQLSRSPTPEKTQAQIDDVVNEILEKYPPKKK